MSTSILTAAFQPVRKAAAGLLEIELSTSYGTRALKVRGKLVCRLLEDGDSLVLRTDFVSREVMLTAQPALSYITEHYRNYPYVLVRLSKVRPAALRELLADSWGLVAPKSLIAKSRK